MKAATPDRARLRWKLLASCVRERTLQFNQDTREVSVRQFQGYDLMHILPYETDTYGTWSQWSLVDSYGYSKSVEVRVLKQTLAAKDLIGFNNTGNVCIWPSEQVLAYYCLKHKTLFSGKNICELGAGMTALAGILLASNVGANHIHLTDGNKTSVQNIQAIISRNSENFVTKDVSSSILVWNIDSELEEMRQKFDVVIASDCLFFEDSHNGLLHVLQTILNKKGLVLMFAPSRGASREKFLSLAASYFEVTVSDDYDTGIYEKHLKLIGTREYEPDRHFPSCIKMKFRKEDS